MILVVVGPTGVGKTRLSLFLAAHYHAEIINADSMQIYKGLDIGTAKIKECEKQGILHHLFDICEVEEDYTVFDYQKEVRKLITEIEERGHNIVLVGGTGLYIKAALFDYRFQEGTTSHLYEDLTNEALLAKLKTYSLEEYPHVHNRRRLVRLLNKLENHEEISTTGNQLIYKDTLFLFLKVPRQILYPKLESRVDLMFEEGLLEEVMRYKAVFPKSKALQTGIGYKEFIPYFKGEQTKEEVREMIKKNTRHYAKRQETFFKHQLPCHTLLVDDNNFSETEKEACRLIDTHFLKQKR